MKTTFVGNPTLDVGPAGDGAAFRDRHGIDANAPCLGVLFGSRMGELDRLFESFSDAVGLLRRQNPSLRLIVPLAGPIEVAARERLAIDPNFADCVIVSESEKADGFAAMDVAMACSGTVTTQLATAGIPTVAGYRLGWITWAIARGVLFKAKFISLVNIAADRELIPERVQTTCTGPRLAADVQRFLDDDDLRRRTSRDLVETTRIMRGEGRASMKAAAAIAEMLT